MLRRCVDQQKAWSHQIDRLVPARFKVDGNEHFREELVWRHIGTDQTVYDIGGGKRPLIPVSVKRERRLRVIGVDIDADELSRAPAGAYDEAICADICTYAGRGDGDLVICQALLEHVPDTGAAFRAISSILRPGGKALLFVPSRNAVFARLNLILPESLKKKILFAIHPGTSERQGFKSYYDACTPRDFEVHAARTGFDVRELELYYLSSYFKFFAPLYATWRAWISLFYAVDSVQAAETFSMVLEKRTT